MKLYINYVSVSVSVSVSVRVEALVVEDWTPVESDSYSVFKFLYGFLRTRSTFVLFLAPIT